MANGLFNLKQVVQAVQQGGWNGGVNPAYAAYFNGSTQYLNVSSATIAATGQFCIEAWVFQTGRSVSTSQGIFSQYSAGVSGRFYFRFNAEKLSFTTSAGDNISTSSVYVNTWYHVAVTRDASNVLRIFINGVLDYNATVTQSLQVTTPQIAAIANGENWQGYISNLRTVSGAIPTAYQTSSTTNGTVVFKPAIEPLSTTSQGASGTSLLTLQNATIVDNSANGYTFTNTGTVTTLINSGVFGAVAKTPAVEYLVVAGGGGGGYSIGAGGGAGGLLTGLDPVPNGQTLLVTVGAGGADSVSGQNSVFGSISSTGGGYGATPYTAGAGIAGGSGGGGTYLAVPRFGQGTFGQGNAGGVAQLDSTNYSTGGGGGAGTVGLNALTVNGGNGGAGIALAISGTVTAYAGGGGGSIHTGGTAGGIGGVGGGGTGGKSGTSNGTNGTANTGGGGGGGSFQAGGGSGGSGIVIVSYPDVYAAPTATTGSPTVSTSGSGSVLFNGSTQYISTSSVAIGTGNFTFETWEYIVSNGANYGRIFGLGDLNSSTGLSLSLNPSTMRLEVNNTAGIILNPAQTYSYNTWYHFALVRSGSTLTLYVNGVSQGAVTLASSLSGIIYVSAVNYLGSIFYGASYTSNYRVTTNAVYTANFTPSTLPLTSISGTILLLNTVSGAPFADNSGTYTPTAVASPTWNQLSPFTGTGYKNRVYTWTSSGSITF